MGGAAKTKSQSGIEGLSFDDEDFDDGEDELLTGDLSSPALDDSRDDSVEEIEEIEEIEDFEEIESVDELDELDEIQAFDELDAYEDSERISISKGAITEDEVGAQMSAQTVTSDEKTETGDVVFSDAGLHEIRVLLKFELWKQASEVAESWRWANGDAAGVRGLAGVAQIHLDDKDAGGEAVLEAARSLVGTEPGVAKFFAEALISAEVRVEEARALLAGDGGAAASSGEPETDASDVELSLGEVEELTASEVDMEIEGVRDETSGLFEIEDLDDDSVVSEVESDGLLSLIHI